MFLTRNSHGSTKLKLNKCSVAECSCTENITAVRCLDKKSWLFLCESHKVLHDKLINELSKVKKI